MADNGAPWEDFAPKTATAPAADGPWSDFSATHSQQEKPQFGEWSRAITDIPSEVRKQYSAAFNAVREGVDPTTPANQSYFEERAKAPFFDIGPNITNALSKGAALANFAYLASGVGPAVVGAARSLIGHPMAELEHKVGEVIAPETAAHDDPEKMYEQAAGDVQGAMGAIGRVPGAPVPSAIPNVVRRAVTPNPMSPEQQAAVNTLREAGVDPTAAMTIGSPVLRRAESTLGSAPFAGRAFPRATQRIYGQFTRYVSRQFGEDADRITPEVLQRARDRLGQQFEDAAANTRILFDPTLGDQITNIRADLMREGLPNETVDRVNAQINNILNGFVTETRSGNRWQRGPQPIAPAAAGADLASSLDDAVSQLNNMTGSNSGATRGMMDGRTYQGLTRHKTPLANAMDEADPNISFYATRLRDALDGALERSARAQGTRAGTGRRLAYDQIVEARRQWANMLAAQKAVVKAGAGPAEGLVTPQNLRGVLTDTEDRKTAYALGRSDLARVARAGNQVIFGDPNSNTSERTLITELPKAITAAFLLGDPVMKGIAATMATPGLTGRLLMSPWVQRYLMNQRLNPQRLPAAGADVAPWGPHSPVVPWQQPSARAAGLTRSRFPWLATAAIPHSVDEGEQHKDGGSVGLRVAYQARADGGETLATSFPNWERDQNTTAVNPRLKWQRQGYQPLDKKGQRTGLSLWDYLRLKNAGVDLDYESSFGSDSPTDMDLFRKRKAGAFHWSNNFKSTPLDAPSALEDQLENNQKASKWNELGVEPLNPASVNGYDI